MKHLKFLFLPIVIISLVSFVKAANCPNVGPGMYDCTAGDFCSPSAPYTQCSCNDGMINSGTTCGTACPFDGYGYVCDSNAGQYCSPNSPYINCDCNGITIVSGAICPVDPTPPLGCTLPRGVTLYVGQPSVIGYQTTGVAFGSSCVGIPLSCNMVGGIPTLTLSTGYNFSSCTVLPPPPPPTGSCSTPRGTTVTSGNLATGSTTSSVACGSTCTSEIRKCSNGLWYSGSIQTNFSSTIHYGSCSVNSCGGGVGNGGGVGSSICTTNYLVCSSGTRALAPGSYCYGGLLGTSCSTTGSNAGTGNLPVGSIAGSTRSTELNNAYLRSYAHSITTMNTITKANMGGVLYRAHMAKMISNFAISLGGLVPNTGKNCTFDDISNQSSELRFYIKLSCQLGLMGLNANGTPDQEFNPEDIVTRAQFGTIMSRVIRGSLYNGGEPYYSPHLLALKNVGIMTQITNPTSVQEIRGYVMIMMKRAYEGGFLNN